MTLKISWSGLRTYSECKNKRHLQVQGKALRTASEQRMFFPGTVTDRVVRDFLDAGGEGDMPEMVSGIMDREEKIVNDGESKILWKNTSDRKSVEKDCREAVTKILPSLEKLVLPNEYQADFSFNAEMKFPHPGGYKESVILNGFMDILVRDAEGNFFVYDVKHTKDNSYWRKTSGQLSFYDLAIRVGEGKYTTGVGLLQPLCDEKVKMIPLDGTSRASIMQLIGGMARDTWAENFELTDKRSICNMCNVKHACKRFQPTIVDGKKRMSF
jgi:CRISPR/Cas system-associated exonuclease Cas4 (RecB family)